jgi:hypothetical protein
MNKSQFIGGIICLVLAGFLTVINLRLPPEDLMFMVGDENIPWLPPIIFGILGVVMLSMAVINRNEEDIEEASDPEIEIDEEKAALNKKLETMSWGLFLIMLGGFMFVPHYTIPKGAWSIGVGAIMLGLNAARYFNKIRMSGFTTFLGVVSMLSGVMQLLGWQSLEGPTILIILGAYLVFKPWFDKRKLFGKAEMS